jgi:hypothetical protein
MPDLHFSIEGAEPVRHAASPQLALKLKVTNRDAEQQIESVILQAQVQIEVTHRQYQESEQGGLLDLFGPPSRWSQTLRTMLWTQASVTVPPFRGSVAVDLMLPCSFDFNLASTKYFHALDRGEIPLALLFSGTIFYQDDRDGLQVAQIPWEREARYRLPLEVWQRTVDHYFPNCASVTLRRDVFDRLHEFKMRNSLPTWEQAVERLLDASDREQDVQAAAAEGTGR